jgi:SAM-dependent methyltransferase
VRGWLGLWTTSVGLGMRHLVRRGWLREAAIRVVIPLDPSRYLELPWALRRLDARAGERVLDLASPKLLAVYLTRHGIDVTSVDAFPEEIERWRRLAPETTFEVADGRALPFPEASFDHAYSISVLEHVDGAEAALAELARVVRPGGRVVLTLPYAREAWDEWRDRPLYGQGDRPVLFQRWYDDARVEALLAAVPSLTPVERSVARLAPNWNELYTRFFPWLLPLGPVYGLLAREVEGEGGDVIRLCLRRRPRS